MKNILDQIFEIFQQKEEKIAQLEESLLLKDEELFNLQEKIKSLESQIETTYHSNHEDYLSYQREIRERDAIIENLKQNEIPNKDKKKHFWNLIK
jgi:chromosome segregation ATPase